MNLEEAIKHCEEVANRKPYFDDKLGGMVYPEGAINTLEEHGQYAEWLKELKTTAENNRLLKRGVVLYENLP